MSKKHGMSQSIYIYYLIYDINNNPNVAGIFFNVGTRLTSNLYPKS